MNPQTFIFMGRSGCGKGTQAALFMDVLAKKDSTHPIYYMESGAQFRAFIEGSSYSSQLAKKINEKGGRQPDFLAVWIWSHLFIEHLSGNEHVVIDGTPRSLPEAMALETALDFYGLTTTIVYVDVSREESQRRLLARGRADDATLAKINERLGWFDADVLPAVEYFKKSSKHTFISVDGEQEKDEVHAEIMSKLILS